MKITINKLIESDSSAPIVIKGFKQLLCSAPVTICSKKQYR